MNPPSPEQRELLQQARHANLLKIWASGRRRLTPEERAEIRHLLPPEEPPPPNVEAPPAPAPEPKAPTITREQLDAWAAVYGTEYRQLRRWINLGREQSDPPPLDLPALMPAWWGRHMKHRVPDKILAAARSATAPAPPPAAAADSAPTIPGATLGSSFDLDAAELGEGEEVKFARQLVAGISQKLREAMAAGDEKQDAFTYWSRQLKDAMETFRKHKADDREAQKARGLLISRAEVECDMFAALKMLAHMRAHMGKRVLAELKAALPDLSEDLAAQIASSIERVRVREEDLFRNLKALQSLDDVSFHLAA